MNNTEKALKLLILASIILVASMLIFALGNQIFRKNTDYHRSFTKAICDSKNSCQDYEIFCKNESVVKMSPITGAVVQFPSDWKDQRTEEERDKLC